MTGRRVRGPGDRRRGRSRASGAGPPCDRASADRKLPCRRAQISSGRATNLRCAGLPSPLSPHHLHEPPAVHQRAHLVFGALSPAPSAGVVSTPARHERLTLTAADVDAIAARVVELLRDERRLALYVDTSAVARMLHVSGDWVRDHAAELGGIRVGDGPKGALRFDVRRVKVALEGRRLRRPRSEPKRRPGPAIRAQGVELLPLPDDAR